MSHYPKDKEQPLRNPFLQLKPGRLQYCMGAR